MKEKSTALAVGCRKKTTIIQSFRRINPLRIKGCAEGMSISSFTLGCLATLHQELFTHASWNWSDLFGVHHETLAFMCWILAGFVLLVNLRRN